MKILVIAEKDTVGLTIADAILEKTGGREADHLIGAIGGDTVLITWPNGHAMELAPPEAYDSAWGNQRDEGILPLVPPLSGFRYQPKHPPYVSRVRDWISRSDEVVNACDAAREGELIFHELVRYCGSLNPKAKLSRLWLTSTTKATVVKAWHARDNALLRYYRDLLESGLARQQADWMWGISFTRKISIACGRRFPRTDGGSIWHIGRCQTPLLKIVHDRALKIEQFQSEEFYRLNAEFSGSGGRFKARVIAFPEMRYGAVDSHFRSFSDVSEMRRHMVMQMHTPWEVQDMKKNVDSAPPPPFDLDDLQQSANMLRDLRFTAKETLDYAQTLYHKEKAITYPRTDSSYLPTNDSGTILALRNKLWAEWAVPMFPQLGKLAPHEPVVRWFDDSKVRDHHAIIPTGVIPAPTNEQGRIRPEYLLWQLITMRFLHAFLPDARILAASRVLLCPFDTTGTKFLRAVLECAPVEHAGWLEHEECTFNTRGHGASLSLLRKEKIYPDCATGEATLQGLWAETGQTTRPEYHDDALLLREMKEANLGTPATRAAHIEGMVTRNYTFRDRTRRIRPTQEGNRLIGVLDSCGGSKLYDAALTASWETQLERMTKRVQEKPTREVFLSGIVEEMHRIIGEIDGKKSVTDLVFCPDSGIRVVESPDHKRWVFGGKFKDAECFLSMRGKDMGAADYRDIFVAGKKGGGPFTFHSKTKGTDYDAWVIWRPNKRGYDQWEIRFKNRGRKTTSGNGPANKP